MSRRAATSAIGATTSYALPFHRLARLRYFFGSDLRSISEECASALGLVVDVPPKSLEARLARELEGTPRHLQIVKSKRLSQKKTSSSQVQDRIEDLLSGVDDKSLSASQYAEKYSLGRYNTNTSKGSERVARALSLWAVDDTRDMLCALLTSRVSTKTIADALNNHCKNVSPVKGKVKHDDIQSFEELLWDFTPYASVDRLDYIEKCPSSDAVSTSIVHGISGFLFRNGYQSVQVSSVEMHRVARDIAFLELNKYRTGKIPFDANQFRTVYGVMESASAYIDSQAENSEASFEEERNALLLMEEDDFAHLDEIIGDAGLGYEEEILRKARRSRVIDEDAYKKGLAWLGAGKSLGREQIDQIRATLDSLEAKKLDSKSSPTAPSDKPAQLVP